MTGQLIVGESPVLSVLAASLETENLHLCWAAGGKQLKIEQQFGSPVFIYTCARVILKVVSD